MVDAMLNVSQMDKKSCAQIQAQKTEMKKSMIALFALAIMGCLSLLAACSGTFGSYGQVMISIPGVEGASRGLYVNADTMVEGYVLLVQDDRAYSVNEYAKTTDLIDGRAYISNIPVGSYLCGIVLQDKNGHTTGLAIKNVSVNAGYNEVEIEVGPGFTELDILDDAGNSIFSNNKLSLNGNSSNYSVSFSEDTIIFDYDRNNKDAKIYYVPFFGTDAQGVSVEYAYFIDTDFKTTTIETFVSNSDIYHGDTVIGADHAGVEYHLKDDGGSTYTLRIILK